MVHSVKAGLIIKPLNAKIEGLMYARRLYMTTSCQFKCVRTFHGSLSIHIFMLLFRLIADSSVFMSDVTRKCKTAIEIGRPFEGMCDNFLLFIIREQTKALIWKAY